VQPNKWSCFPTALAICLGVKVDDVILAIGHDGSAVIWPELEDPACRQGFHDQEILLAAEACGMSLVRYDKHPTSYVQMDMPPHKLDYSARFEEVVMTYDGILVGKTMEGKDHAVAWDRHMCLDPMGHRYAINYFEPEHFFRLVEIARSIQAVKYFGKCH
jgi:hypothetical protein